MITILGVRAPDTGNASAGVPLFVSSSGSPDIAIHPARTAGSLSAPIAAASAVPTADCFCFFVRVKSFLIPNGVSYEKHHDEANCPSARIRHKNCFKVNILQNINAQ
jgi:hypothetical protein